MKHLKAKLFGLGVIGLFVVQDYFKGKEGVLKAPEFPKVTANVPGYRRAKQSEVTPSMTDAAILSLHSPLGAVIKKDGFAVAIETHYDLTRGYHKGASIFLPA